MNGNYEQADGNARVDCSVLMPVLNEEHAIAASVAAMRAQRFEGRLEFLVVDGGSTDRTSELLRELAREDERIRILQNPRRITSSALNVALSEARGRWVARMDAHTEYQPDYLARGVRRLQEGGTRWVSGPPVATGDGTVSRAVALALRTPLGRGASRKWAAELAGRGAEYELDAGVFAGVWERQTLLEYGGWDEDWVVNQDSEMAGRFLGQAEVLICLPAMAAFYAPRNSLRLLWRQYLRYGEYREKTAVRHPHTMRRSHVLAPGLVGAVLSAIAAPKPLRTPARVVVGSYLTSLVGAGALASRDAERWQDAAMVPAALAVMHLAHGVGALRGAVRHGAPVAALCGVAGMKGLARRLAPSSYEVFAPSLRGEQSFEQPFRKEQPSLNEESSLQEKPEVSP